MKLWSFIANTVLLAAVGSAEYSNEDVQIASKSFEGKLLNYRSLKITKEDEGDEAVLAWMSTGDMWITHDQGSSWFKSPISYPVRVLEHPFFNERVYVQTRDDKLYYSSDHAKSFKVLTTPARLNKYGYLLRFHKDNPNNIILLTEDDCDASSSQYCTDTAWYSLDGGIKWKKLLDKVDGCMWVYGLENLDSPQQIMCSQYDAETNTKLAVTSKDFFRSKKVVLENIRGMVLQEPFVVVAAYDRRSTGQPDAALISYVSSDAENFVRAHYPPDISVSHNMGYTVLDSKTKTLFMDVATHRDWGTILKSNANGTEFVEIINGVNRSPQGYVDFEKGSIEGVSLANVVTNLDDVSHGSSKLIKTKISHTDGALWNYLKPPAGLCGDTPIEECSMHLHGYTERYTIKNSPSSPSAVGLIIANGNVGSSLVPMTESGTYMSSDAGDTWFEIDEDPVLWEFGDSGSIIVTVPYLAPTNTIKYSTNEGKSWTQYQFTEEFVQVLNVVNIPSDTSRKFVMFTRSPRDEGDNTYAFSLDFSQLATRRCDIGDFYEWEPFGGNECLFGHEISYLRKSIDSECFVGKVMEDSKKIGQPVTFKKNCKCERKDFECDFNYKLAEDGTCKLIEGYSKPTMEDQCANGAIAWHDVTGYRRIPIDTCEGGENLAPPRWLACPGKEVEFEDKFGDGSDHGTPSGGSIFKTIIFLFVLFGAFGALGIFVAGQLGKRGSITLGDAGEGFNRIAGDRGERFLEVVLAGAGALFSKVKGATEALVGRANSRFSRNALYERLDDEERARILDDRDLEEDELDNPELRDFELYEDE